MFAVGKENTQTAEIAKIWQVLTRNGQHVPQTLQPPLLITPSHIIRDPTPLQSYPKFLQLKRENCDEHLYKHLMLGVLQALVFVHEHSLRHGAVKPENILIDSNRNALLTDCSMSSGSSSDDTIALAQCAFEGACHTSALDEFRQTQTTMELQDFWLSFIRNKRSHNIMTQQLAKLLIGVDFIAKEALQQLLISSCNSS